MPKGRRDLTWRQHPGRRLVEEGLEEMVISAVDQCHVDRFPAEEAGGRKTTESTPDDDDPMPAEVESGATVIGSRLVAQPSCLLPQRTGQRSG